RGGLTVEAAGVLDLDAIGEPMEADGGRGTVGPVHHCVEEQLAQGNHRVVLVPLLSQSGGAHGPCADPHAHEGVEFAEHGQQVAGEAPLVQRVVCEGLAKTQLLLDQSDGIPLLKVYPDTDTKLPVKKVDIYYGYGRDPRIRFWRDGLAKKTGDHWEAKCPVFYTDEPLFAFANITYGIGRELPLPSGYSKTISEVAISSQYQAAYPDQLKKANVKATEKPKRLIDDFSRGFHDWYTLSIDNTEHWFLATRKIVDPSWVGPKNGKLTFEIKNPEPGNTLAVVARINDWIGYTGRKKDVFTAVATLDKKGTLTVSLSASDFKNSKGESMSDWDQITELIFRAADKALPDNKKLKPWQGNVPTLQNLRWEDGVYTTRPKIHETAKDFSDFYSSNDFEKEFQKAIDESVKLEKLDAKKK
ncbi:MAG: hypothetical protein H8D47_02790, partial [Planctomycetes bacterium]|nr:hypothetical protein [Planctomycetota bacterium]